MLREYSLLRGQGLDLGPYALRYPEHGADDAARDRRPGRDPRATRTGWSSTAPTGSRSAGGWREICRVGHALDRDGFEPAAHVGLLLRNQPEFLPAFYGPQVRGGVSIPLNADSRGPLLQAVIEH